MHGELVEDPRGGLRESQALAVLTTELTVAAGRMTDRAPGGVMSRAPSTSPLGNKIKKK